MSTDYTLEELAKAYCEADVEQLKELMALAELYNEEKEKYDENIIRECSYERPNKRSYRIFNAESKRKSRVAFHAAPGTYQYIRGRDGGGRYR